MNKNNAPARSLTFWYISLQFTAKQQRQIRDQIIGFMDNINTQRLIFLSVFKLKSRSYKF